MTSAYGQLTYTQKWIALAVFFAVTVLFMVVLAIQGEQLKTEEGEKAENIVPLGVLSFEFAGNSQEAGKILSFWESKDSLPEARKQLHIDFGFLLVYPVFLSLACAMLAEAPRNFLPLAGIFISWAVLAAAPLDALENLALLHMIAHGPSEFYSKLAWWCAGVKFLLVFSALGYLVLQGLAMLTARMR